MQTMRIEMAKNLSFSRVALGYWRYHEWGLTDNELVNFIDECIDLGITTMDHADIYGNYLTEQEVGNVLKRHPSLSKRMEIVTKCTIVYPSSTGRVKYYDSSEKYIISQADKSLKNLGIDHIDLFLLHRPDPFMDPTEVSLAFEKLHKQGKVSYFGVSNYLPHEYRMLKSYLTAPLISNQVELSCLHMDNLENGVIALCQEERIHPMIWSPLAGGKIFTGEGATETRLRETLEIIREEIGASSIDVVAFAWLLSHPVKPIPITGSGIIDYVKKPIEALKYQLTKEQWFMIWTAVKGHKVP